MPRESGQQGRLPVVPVEGLQKPSNSPQRKRLMQIIISPFIRLLFAYPLILSLTVPGGLVNGDSSKTGDKSWQLTHCRTDIFPASILEFSEARLKHKPPRPHRPVPTPRIFEALL